MSLPFLIRIAEKLNSWGFFKDNFPQTLENENLKIPGLLICTSSLATEALTSPGRIGIPATKILHVPNVTSLEKAETSVLFFFSSTGPSELF